MHSRIAVLASGGGSNLQAILDHGDQLGEQRRGRVALVVANRSGAGALERARRREISTVVLTQPDDPAELSDALDAHAIDLVVLAGYLKLVPPEVVRRFSGRMLNVHPALLPSFGGPGMYGERVHAAVLASGVRITGPTVHFVSEEYDRGTIAAQWPVPVLPDDDVKSLAARVLAAEHALLPQVVEGLAAGRIALSGENIVRLPSPPANGLCFALRDDARASAAAGLELLLSP